MLKKTLVFTDFNGVETTEDHYFNLSMAELIRMEFTSGGDLEEYIKKISKERDANKLFALFEKVVKMSYGEKDPTGRRFIKSDESTNAFMETGAYDALMVELFQADRAAEFFAGIIPKQPQDRKAPQDRQKQRIMGTVN